MNYTVYLLIPLLFSLSIINLLQCFTIKPQKFIDVIYTENQWLPKECGQHISDILKRYQNDQGTVTVNRKVRKWIWWHTLSIATKYEKCSPKHKAALVTHRMLNKLATQQKNTPLDCPICTDLIGTQRTELACSHVFCTECLLTWFAQDKPEKPGNHTACPMCRVKITKQAQDSFKKNPIYAKKLAGNLKKKNAEDWTIFLQELHEENEHNRQTWLLTSRNRRLFNLLYEPIESDESSHEDFGDSND